MISIHTNEDSPDQIFAYVIPIGPMYDQMRPLKVELPKYATILSAGFLGSKPNELCIWALINKHQWSEEIRKFYVIGTGEGFPSPPNTRLNYIGVATSPHREVFHVFEAIEDEPTD
jgi:hypothetical protein